jgi:hypothetical protein
MGITVVAGGSGVLPVVVGSVVGLGTIGRQLLGRRSVIVRRDALYVHDLDRRLGGGRCVVPRESIGSITPIVTLPIMPATNLVSLLPAQTTADETSATVAVVDRKTRRMRSAAAADQQVMYEWHHGRLSEYTVVQPTWLDRCVSAFGEFLVADRRTVLPRPNLRIEFAEPRLVRRRTLIGRLPFRSSRHRDGIEIAVQDVDDACERLDSWLAGR